MDKTIRVSPDLHHKAKVYAYATGQTLSEFTEKAMRDAMDTDIGRQLRDVAVSHPSAPAG